MTETERAIWIAAYGAAMANSFGCRQDECADIADRAVRDVQSVAGKGAPEIRFRIQQEREGAR